MRVLCVGSVLLYVIFQSLRMCAGGAVLKAAMGTFWNSIGKDIDNDCCDWPCFNRCDHVFTFYFDNDQWSTGKFKDRNVISFRSDMEGVSNPIVMRFPQWKGSVRMKVKVMDDDDGYANDDMVDEIFYTYKGTPGPTSGSPNIQHHNLAGRRSNRGILPTTLSVRFELYCEQTFYGTACDVECVPRDDDRGHYLCDPNTGDIVCMEGYTGQNCTQKACDVIKCENGRTCTDGVCICPPGSFEPHCKVDACVSQECYNGGVCQRERCLCLSGFKGSNCELNISKCESLPCQHLGHCVDLLNSYKCLCQKPYAGVNCDVVNGIESPNSETFPDTDKVEKPDDAKRTEKPQDVNVIPIAVGVAAGVLLLLIIPLVVLIVRWRRGKRQAGTRRGSLGVHCDNQTNSSMSVIRNGDVKNNYYSPPPSYPNVTVPERERQSLLPPPSYDSKVHADPLQIKHKPV